MLLINVIVSSFELLHHIFHPTNTTATDISFQFQAQHYFFRYQPSSFGSNRSIHCQRLTLFGMTGGARGSFLKKHSFSCATVGRTAPPSNNFVSLSTRLVGTALHYPHLNTRVNSNRLEKCTGLFYDPQYMMFRPHQVTLPYPLTHMGLTLF